MTCNLLHLFLAAGSKKGGAGGFVCTMRFVTISSHLHAHHAWACDVALLPLQPNGFSTPLTREAKHSASFLVSRIAMFVSQVQ